MQIAAGLVVVGAGAATVLYEVGQYNANALVVALGVLAMVLGGVCVTEALEDGEADG